MSLYLAAHASRAGVLAAVVSDADGFLISGTGDVDQEVLAAVGPLFVTQGTTRLAPTTEELIHSVVQTHDLYASRLQVHGTTLVLTTLGARFPEQRRAERAFERILQESESRA